MVLSFFCAPLLVSWLARHAHCAQSHVGAQTAGRRSKECFHLHQRHTTAHAKTVILMKTIGTSQLWDPSPGRAAKFAWNRPINTEVIKKCWMSWTGEKRRSVSAKIFLWKSGNQKNKEVFQQLSRDPDSGSGMNYYSCATDHFYFFQIKQWTLILLIHGSQWLSPT